MPEEKWIDILDGNWIERNYANGKKERYKYLGVIVPSEPFLAVFADEDGTIETEPVHAFIIRITYRDGLHFDEFIPVTYKMDYLSMEEAENLIGVVPQKDFEKHRAYFEKRAKKGIPKDPNILTHREFDIGIQRFGFPQVLSKGERYFKGVTLKKEWKEKLERGEA
jgi:hypothetical protein